MLLHELIYQLLPQIVPTPVGIFTCFLIYYFLCFLKNSLISSFNSDWLLTRSAAKHDIGYLFFSFLPFKFLEYRCTPSFQGACHKLKAKYSYCA